MFWMKHQKYKQALVEAWSSVLSGSPVQHIYLKLKQVKQHLKFNKDYFIQSFTKMFRVGAGASVATPESL